MALAPTLKSLAPRSPPVLWLLALWLPVLPWGTIVAVGAVFIAARTHGNGDLVELVVAAFSFGAFSRDARDGS